MTLFIPPASGPFPPVPELLPLRRPRVRQASRRDKNGLQVMDGLLAFVRDQTTVRRAERHSARSGYGKA